jgi:hypothetical protein
MTVRPVHQELHTMTGSDKGLEAADCEVGDKRTGALASEDE